jgi:hypothetical protein
MNDPRPRAAREAAAVTEAALALAGHEMDAFTCELTSDMGRGALPLAAGWR